MQLAHNELQEVIWEITNQCNQNCSYCGSKDIINTTVINSDRIDQIADNIASYPPKEINISGGNPLIVPYGNHEYITSLFKEKGIVCKIIVNPFNMIDEFRAKKKIDLYSWIGFSVNNKAELDEINNLFKSKFCQEKTTIITNFNISNIFLFNEILDFVKKGNYGWQIQYTMYDGDNENAIYQNAVAKEFLFKLISEANYKNLIIADNMNQGRCGAGKNALGILANGDVIPCLSMRSWEQNHNIIGNMLDQDLEDIWVNRFARFRCSEFKCCKDVTKCIPASIQTLTTNVQKVEPVKWIHDLPRPVDNAVFVYGVQPSQVVVYAVQRISTGTKEWVPEFNESPNTSSTTYPFSDTIITGDKIS